jgi:mannose/fructose/N-acetylgalactosamine-specific phosphotransferase system component IIB
MSDQSGQQTVMLITRERLAVSKQTMHGVHMERFNLKKLNEVDGKEQYHAKISNRFAALKNLDAEVDIDKAWETIRISKFQPKRD